MILKVVSNVLKFIQETQDRNIFMMVKPKPK